MLKKEKEEILKNWTTLNEKITELSTEQAKELLAYEKANANRKTFVKRISQRFASAFRESLNQGL